MAVRHIPAVLAGRAARWAARLRKPGGGSAVPGLVVNRLAPRFLADSLRTLDRGLVIVTGSAGKSTVTKVLTAILQSHGMRVFTNPSTANIAQGLTSSVLEHSSVTGRLDADIGVLEMDEGHAAKLAPHLEVDTVVLTNVLTDQIDRFYDSDMVASLLRTVAECARDCVIVNADDAYLADIAQSLAPSMRRLWFGVSRNVRDQVGAASLGYAATVPSPVDDGVRVTSTEGRSACLGMPGESALTVAIPAAGIHFAVDAAAAVTAARAVLGDAFDREIVADAARKVEPVFGRGERVRIGGEDVEFVLVQNTASLQLNVELLDPNSEQVFMAMGSDVRDPGYLWPADLGHLRRVRCASGSKAHELALQLLYQGVQVDEVDDDLPTSLDRFLRLPTPSRGVKTIVFTADSMRRTRSHLGLAE